MVEFSERDEIDALLQHAARIRSDIKTSLSPVNKPSSTIKCAGCYEENSIYSSWCIKCGLKPGDKPPIRCKPAQKPYTVFNSEQILYPERVQISPPREINTTTPPKVGRPISLSYIKKQDPSVTPPLIDSTEEIDSDVEPRCEANGSLLDIGIENETERYTGDVIIYDRSNVEKHKKKLVIKPISEAKPRPEDNKNVRNAWGNPPVCKSTAPARPKSAGVLRSASTVRLTQSKSNINDLSSESSIITRLCNATKRPNSSCSKQPSSVGPKRPSSAGPKRPGSADPKRSEIPKRPNSADVKRPSSAGPKRSPSGNTVFERLYNNESRTKEKFSSSMPHLLQPTLKTSTVSLAAPNKHQLSLQTNTTKPKQKVARTVGQKAVKAFPKSLCGTPLTVSGQRSPLPYRHSVTKAQYSYKLQVEVEWLSLPAELWLHILSFLPSYTQCSLVCSQLYEIVQDTSLWDKINIQGLTLTDEHLISIGNRQPRLLSFTACKGDDITSTGLRALFRSCEDSLEALLVSECTGGELISSSLLLHLSARCRNLHNLHLSWCNITDEALTRTAERSHRLKSVCVPGCRNISDISFRTVLQRHYSTLTRVDLSGCYNISASAIQQLSHCPELAELYLGNCSQITDLTLTTLSAKCCHLRVLDLRGCKRLSGQGITSLLAVNPHVHTLSLAYVAHLTDADLENVSNSLVSLYVVDLSGCTKISSVGIKALTRHPVKALDLGSTSISYRGCVAIANYLCSSLTELSLNCTDVNDECLRKVVSKCKKLARVSIFGCKYVRDVSFLYHLNPLMILES